MQFDFEEDMFQFVPSRGGQPECQKEAPKALLFQFVPSRGGQPSRADRVNRALCFNSCPRAEGNLSIQCAVFQNSVSIRALARRATRISRASKANASCFNSCPRAEGNG